MKDIMSIKPTTFKAVDFTSDGAVKARTLNMLTKWIVNGMPQPEWDKADKPMYYALRQYLGHIAHYNRYGFWDVWFLDPVKQVEFLDFHIESNSYGSPDWDEVKVAFVDWIIRSGIYEEYILKRNIYLREVNITTARRALAYLPTEDREAIAAEAGIDV